MAGQQLSHYNLSYPWRQILSFSYSPFHLSKVLISFASPDNHISNLLIIFIAVPWSPFWIITPPPLIPLSVHKKRYEERERCSNKPRMHNFMGYSYQVSGYNAFSSFIEIDTTIFPFSSYFKDYSVKQVGRKYWPLSSYLFKHNKLHLLVQKYQCIDLFHKYLLNTSVTCQAQYHSLCGFSFWSEQPAYAHLNSLRISEMSLQPHPQYG